jgi:hypothetical protein
VLLPAFYDVAKGFQLERQFLSFTVAIGFIGDKPSNLAVGSGGEKAMGGAMGFGRLRPLLKKQQPAQLVRLIGELYRMSRENQRFLEARLGNASQLSEYRRLISECLFPDVLKGDVRINEAKRAIKQYKQASQDLTGIVDLRLTFVESGTAFALDCGYGGDAFFNALEHVLSRALALLACDKNLRKAMRPRLMRLADSASSLGWGYGNYVGDEISEMIRRDE